VSILPSWYVEKRKIPPNELPRWLPRNDKERQRMHVWVNHELDLILETEFERNQRVNRGDGWLNLCKVRARYGDYEPLRQRLPDFAEFLNPPKGTKHIHSPKPPSAVLDPVREAAKDVRRIRAIWQQHYGKKNRSAEEGPSAVQIAAERWTDKDGVQQVIVSGGKILKRLYHLKK
jgi:hypothetical protein